MRLINAWHGNKGEPVSNAKGTRLYQVRWKLDPGGGRKPIERTLSTFRSKGEARAFIERLRHAEFATADWSFNEDGHPVQGVHSAASVVDTVEAYVADRWEMWQPNHRCKARGRFLDLIALTVTKPGDRVRLLEALGQQVTNRGSRPDPTTTISWAARWLRDTAFYPHPPPEDRQPSADDAIHLDAGRRWLIANSMSVGALDTTESSRLRRHFTDGRPHSTARTYWKGTIVPYFNWLQDTGKVTTLLTAGQPKLKRDAIGERPDPRDIPNQDQLDEIAEAMGASRGKHHRRWQLFVLLTGYCALRISEALAVRLSAFEFDGERWWLRVTVQEYRVPRACSDDGVSTRVATSPKSTRDNSPPPRLVPIPDHLAVRLVADYGDTLGVSDVRLFTGPRGGIANDTDVRKWWHAAVATALGSDHRLVDVNPHVLRHAGMTFWFEARVDEALIQKWGGWRSLKEMQDTYRGVTDSLRRYSLEAIDRLPKPTDNTPPTASFGPGSANDSHGTAAPSNVISMDVFRRRNDITQNSATGHSSSEP